MSRWFNTSAFAQPASGTYGDARAEHTNATGVNNLDLALFKNLAVTRGVRLQFRLESFNAFNHTQFQTVTTNLTAANFGVVTAARPARINQLGVKLLF